MCRPLLWNVWGLYKTATFECIWLNTIKIIKHFVSDCFLSATSALRHIKTQLMTPAWLLILDWWIFERACSLWFKGPRVSCGKCSSTSFTQCAHPHSASLASPSRCHLTWLPQLCGTTAAICSVTLMSWLEEGDNTVVPLTAHSLWCRARLCCYSPFLIFLTGAS